MKFAILGARGIPARYGGFETFAEELAVRLVKKGVDVTVYCEAGAEQPDSYKGVRLVYVPSPSLGPFTTILFDLRCLWHARKDYDTVYMLGYGASIFCFIPRLWGRKVWINMDGIEWARAKWSFPAKVYFKVMEAMAMWTPNRIIADAEGIKQFLSSRHMHLPPCSVIPYGAQVVDRPPDVALLTEWGLQPSKYLLVVSRLEPENHVLEILRGFSMSESRLPLVVVGNNQIDTPYIERLKEFSDIRIRFIGAVYDKAKLQSLRYYCKAYFHGHSVGGTNPSLLEAIGCGNAVIAHDNPFNREVLGGLGVYFNSQDDIPLLVNSMEERGKALSDGISQRMRERIRDVYNWDLISERYLEILRK